MKKVSENFDRRPLVKLQIPLPEKTRLIRPESVVLSFLPGGSIDLGSICFMQRQTGRRARDAGTLVNLQSLNVARRPVVAKLIRHISSERAIYRPTTLAHRYNAFLRFMSWADSKPGQDPLLSKVAARARLAGFIAYLSERVQTGKMSMHVAVVTQNDVASVYKAFFSIDDPFDGIERLREQLKLSERHTPTLPPSEDAQGRQLALSKYLFTGLSSLLIEGRPFPFHLSLPKYLDPSAKGIWLFPARSSFRTSAELNKPHILSYPRPFNHETGTLLRPAGTWKKNYRAHRAYQTSMLRLRDWNDNLRHSGRLRLANTANQAFQSLFVAKTGTNWSVMRELPWNSEYTISAENQSYRAIKFRANDKEVSITISVSFLADFKKFLQLRDYVLAGKNFPFLFFSLGLDSTMPHQLKIQPETGKLRFFKGLDPELEFIGTKKWRAARTNRLINTHGIDITSQVVQTSKPVIERNYASGTPTQAIKEMGAFLTKIVSIITRKRRASDKSCMVGSCTSPGHPIPLKSPEWVKPDCNQAEGCLFCDRHYMIADDIDVRKLLSAKFCIEKTKLLSRNISEWEEMFRPVLGQIDLLLKRILEISNKHASMVNRVTNEVNNDGILDPYWQTEIDMLDTLTGGSIW